MAASSKVMEMLPCVSALREHVREIVESPAFKGSRRGQQFLQYVVEKALEGHSDALKERNLGVELFGRLPSYDTGEDAIVRVTASDVRKRLHHFYAEFGSSAEIRIDLPSGSYIPEFRRFPIPAPSPSAMAFETAAAPETTRAAVQRSRFRWRRWALCLVAELILGLAFWLWHNHNSAGRISPKDVLPWAAILRDDRQVHVIYSDPDISSIQMLLGFDISLSDYANQRYVPHVESLDPNLQRVIQSSLRGTNVPIIDMRIALRIAEMALVSSKPLKTHTARSMQLRDFRTQDNFIFLGSPRSNPWVRLFEDQLGFGFVYDSALKEEVIQNRRPRSGELALYIPTAMGWDTGQSFAVVAFLGNPGQTGQLLLLAGTNAEGTEAADEFATNLELLSQTLRKNGMDPNGVPQHFEVLLRVNSMAGGPSSFEVIACRHLRDNPATSLLRVF